MTRNLSKGKWGRRGKGHSQGREQDVQRYKELNQHRGFCVEYFWNGRDGGREDAVAGAGEGPLQGYGGCCHASEQGNAS